MLVYSKACIKDARGYKEQELIHMLFTMPKYIRIWLLMIDDGNNS